MAEIKHRMDIPRSAGLNKGSAPLAFHRGKAPEKRGHRLQSASAQTRSQKARFLKKQPMGDNVVPLVRLPTRPPPLKVIVSPRSEPIKKAPSAPSSSRGTHSKRFEPKDKKTKPPASSADALLNPPATVAPEPAALPGWLKKAMAAQTATTLPPEPTTTLSNAERERLFGKFTFRATPVPGDLERVFVEPPWPQQNILEVQIPLLKRVQGIPFRGVSLHKLVMPHFEELVAAWEKEGLIPKIITWNGGYVPRFRRGQADKRILSAHAWGSAFDINARWNPFRKPSAPPKTEGSVRELAVVAKRLGWIWGGDFRTPDGMHFEAGPRLLGLSEKATDGEEDA